MSVFSIGLRQFLGIIWSQRGCDPEVEKLCHTERNKCKQRYKINSIIYSLVSMDAIEKVELGKSQIIRGEPRCLSFPERCTSLLLSAIWTNSKLKPPEHRSQVLWDLGQVVSGNKRHDYYQLHCMHNELKQQATLLDQWAVCDTALGQNAFLSFDACAL